MSKREGSAHGLNLPSLTLAKDCSSGLFGVPIPGSRTFLCSPSNSRIQKILSGSQLTGQNLPESVYFTELFLQLISGKEVSLVS